MSTNTKTYTETYKIWDIYLCEQRARYYAYDSLLESSSCCASDEYLSELYRKLDKLWNEE